MTQRFSPEETLVILGRSRRSCYSSASYAWLLEIVSKLIILLFPYLSVTPSDNGIIYTTVGWISPNGNECRTSAIPPENELYYFLRNRTNGQLILRHGSSASRCSTYVNNLTEREKQHNAFNYLLFVQRRRHDEEV